jgi:hypothetical protein
VPEAGDLELVSDSHILTEAHEGDNNMKRQRRRLDFLIWEEM